MLFPSPPSTPPTIFHKLGERSGKVVEDTTPSPPKQPCDGSGKHIPRDADIVYMTDTAGVFELVEEGLWNKFIKENCPSPLPQYMNRFTFPNLLGTSLFEFITDLSTQSFFRHIIASVTSGTGGTTRFTYGWFCDSPDYERRMRMTVVGITGTNGKKLVVWISTILSETPHPRRANYLGRKALPVASPGELQAKPVRTVCTYCKRILVTVKEINQLADLVLLTMVDSGYPLMDDSATGKVPIIGLRGKLGQHASNTVDHAWLTPTQYADAFISSDIIINHGICEICYDEIYSLFMKGVATVA
ncbi:hypothetical protein M427DRAFT_61189 [Gonapodya prolifera JEL478]|uniref:Uncharacterized protein n=1 Tax=Gonapodya prolifera (strain JEL478) TaxID=1344416 RepID=A0A139A2V2_GONPJ|nr:hypothetical protein M427DRAFT_61189 [Gonapodya prolifera JEL478]|eukprot:KXS11102.1 hypothetical protein M427DRAFT_61189 [Gonapodya prolifera JEL478]